jgi:hypothetical protein
LLQADSFPAATGVVSQNRRGSRPAPAVDMNEGLVWLEWREPVNQDVDLPDILKLSWERGPLFNCILIRSVVGPSDLYMNRAAALMHRLQVGQSATVSGVKITHISKGTVAVEYPGQWKCVFCSVCLWVLMLFEQDQR